MHVLNTVFEVLLPHRQNTGEPLTTSAHPGSHATAAIGSAAEEPDQVILDCGPSEDVRTQNVNASTAQRRRALPDDIVALSFVHAVRIGVSAERRVLR